MKQRELLVYAIVASVLVTGVAFVVAGIDYSREETLGDGSLYVGALALVYVVGDALRRSLRKMR